MYQMGLFDVDDAYARVDACGDPLAKLQAMINWNGLEKLMNGITFDVDGNGGKGGRKPLCGLMMAKIMILQACNNLSDDRVEFLINDRLSYKRFLSLGLSQKAPDAKTIWLWRERIRHGGLHEKIFAWFESELVKAGFEAKGGQIVDATFVPTHKPTDKHKKQFAEEIPLTKAQMRQSDTNATFTKKGNVTYHGYKNHTSVDAKWKLIRMQKVSTASVHDSQKLTEIIRSPSENASAEDRQLWADSAYRSEATEVMLKEKGLCSQIHERAYRKHPLTEVQKIANRMKSKVRARIEHVYGHMETAMGGMLIHTIGLGRAAVKVAFKNLAYNMQRFAFLESRHKQEHCA